MLISRRFGQTNPERLFMHVRNSTGSVMSQGYLVCAALINISSANGYDIEKPATSNLALYMGVVEDSSIGTQNFGVIQVWGENENAYVRFESTDGTVPEGTILGPINGQWYAQSNGRSYGLGPLVLMSRHGAATFEGQTKLFIRGL